MHKLVVVIALALASTAGVADGQPREREVLRERPSGFWTSNRPAVGGAYRWRLLGLGVAIAGVTGIVMLRVLRNAKGPQDRARRQR